MMKKLLLAAAVLLLVFWVSICILIPAPLTVSAVVYVTAPVRTVNNFSTNPVNWQHWWPGTVRGQQYLYHACRYSSIPQTPFSTAVFAQAGSDTFTSRIQVLPVSKDTAIVEWKTELPASGNPFTRIKQYNRALGIRQDLQLLLDSLAAFINTPDHIYGLAIQSSRFAKPFIISTRAVFQAYPSVDDIYQIIGRLRNYAKAEQAVAVDSPMINIELFENNHYLLRTALPVNKKLDGNSGIEFKQMMLGNMLSATVPGGRSAVENALLQMQNYISDYGLSTMAIPFQLLITNRQQQPDSSKWVTRLYYPVL